MKNIVKKYGVIFFLLLGPILDVFSFYENPFNIICRTIFLISIILYLLFNKKDYKYLLPLLIFSIIMFFYQYIYLNINLIGVCSNILKFLYLPMGMLFFKNYDLEIPKEQVLTIIIFTYLIIYYFSYFTGLGANAYLETDGKSGFKGLFSSINEFSAILVCLIPVVFTYLNNKRKYITLVLLIFLITGCSLLIGAKVLLGGLIFGIGYLLFQERKRLFFDRSLKSKIVILIFIVGVIISGCYLFTKTRTYKNMLVQNDFFKVEKVLSLEYLNKVIYNDRFSFAGTNFKYFGRQGIVKQLFGIGIQDTNVKMIEIDFLDIIIRYGIVGFLVFTISSILIISKCKVQGSNLLSLILLVIISLTSGHVLFYPAVSIYFGVLLERRLVKNENRVSYS